MSKFDTCIFAEYFGDYGMRLCNHPSRGKHKTIYSEDCRKCKLHQTRSKGLKECPFCGGKAKISQYCGDFHVFCTKCQVEMKDNDIVKVMNRWNQRR